MLESPVALVIALVAVGALLFTFFRMRATRTMDVYMHSHDATATFAGHAELIDGSRHVPVALTLDHTSIHYQNTDIDASIPLDYVSEVEYDTELMTGKNVLVGQVLRLRCSSQVYEFVLPIAEAGRWRTELPSRIASH